MFYQLCAAVAPTATDVDSSNLNNSSCDAVPVPAATSEMSTIFTH